MTKKAVTLMLFCCITLLAACNQTPEVLEKDQEVVSGTVTVPVEWYDARDAKQVEQLIEVSPQNAEEIREYVSTLNQGELDRGETLDLQQITACNLTGKLITNAFRRTVYARNELDCFYRFDQATLRPEVLNQDTLEGKSFSKPCLPGYSCNANTSGIPKRSGEEYCAYGDVTVYIGNSIGNASVEPPICKVY